MPTIAEAAARYRFGEFEELDEMGQAMHKYTLKILNITPEEFTNSFFYAKEQACL